MVTSRFHRSFSKSYFLLSAALRLLLPATSVIPEFLRFKAERITEFTYTRKSLFAGIGGSTPRCKAGLFPHRGRQLLRPEVPHVLKRTCSATRVFVDAAGSPDLYRFPSAITDRQQSSTEGIPTVWAENTPSLGALTALCSPSWPQAWFRC